MPIRDPNRKCQRIGGSVMVALPPEWLKAHNITEGDVQKGLSVAMIGNRHLVVFNPRDREKIVKEWYKKTSRDVKTEVRKIELEAEKR